MSLWRLKSLRFEALSFGYDRPNSVLASCDFSFPVSGVSKLAAGKAGLGRSSVLRLLAGLLQPTEGKYYVNDDCASEMSFEEFLPIRTAIGFSFDMGGLLNNRTLRDNLLLPLQYHKVLKPQLMDERVDHLLTEFQIDKVAHLRPSAVSGSQRKAACVARSLVMKPSLLILDEPTIGLSPQTIQVLRSKVLHLVETKELQAVIVASEDPRLLDGIVSQEIELQDGKIRSRSQIKAVSA